MESYHHFQSPFLHSDKDLSHTHCVPGTILGTDNRTGNGTHTDAHAIGVHILADADCLKEKYTGQYRKVLSAVKKNEARNEGGHSRE